MSQKMFENEHLIEYFLIFKLHDSHFKIGLIFTSIVNEDDKYGYSTTWQNSNH
jgi:hypothetical protein